MSCLFFLQSIGWFAITRHSTSLLPTEMHPEKHNGEQVRECKIVLDPGRIFQVTTMIANVCFNWLGAYPGRVEYRIMQIYNAFRLCVGTWCRLCASTHVSIGATSVGTGMAGPNLRRKKFPNCSRAPTNMYNVLSAIGSLV
jgi:hypothetical protein